MILKSDYLFGKTNKIVLAVIHQPRAPIFNLFDYIMILAEGRTVYFGPTSHCLSYFNNLGYSCPVWENPADYLLDIISYDTSNEYLQDQSKSRIRSIQEVWKQFILHTGGYAPITNTTSSTTSNTTMTTTATTTTSNTTTTATTTAAATATSSKTTNIKNSSNADINKNPMTPPKSTTDSMSTTMSTTNVTPPPKPHRPTTTTILLALFTATVTITAVTAAVKFILFHTLPRSR